MRRSLCLLALTVALSPGVGFALTAAPQPAKTIEIRSYIGRWYEIARLHNRTEEGCASASADYAQSADGKITAAETCHKATGADRVWRASVTILDPGANDKLRLSFFPFVSKEYWVLDRATDYRWAIVGTADGKYLWLFARRADIPQSEKAEIVQRAGALGYDTSKLIYP